MTQRFQHAIDLLMVAQLADPERRVELGAAVAALYDAGKRTAPGRGRLRTGKLKRGGTVQVRVYTCERCGAETSYVEGVVLAAGTTYVCARCAARHYGQC